jgi:hypothetical protein
MNIDFDIDIDIDDAAELATPLAGWAGITDVVCRIQDRRPRHLRPGFDPHSLAQRAAADRHRGPPSSSFIRSYRACRA